MTIDNRPCYLQVGQKVTFVGRGGYLGYQALKLSVPIRGCIYTVREIYMCPERPWVVGIRLAEFIYPISPIGAEYGFWHAEFKPLVTRKTDISVFTKMLRPALEDA